MPHPVPRRRRDSDQIVLAASAQAAFPGAGVLPGDHFSILDPGDPGNATAETVKHYILADLAAAPRPVRRPAAAPATAPRATAPPAVAGPGEAAGKYRIDIKDSQGVVVGDQTRT